MPAQETYLPPVSWVTVETGGLLTPPVRLIIQPAYTTMYLQGERVSTAYRSLQRCTLGIAHVQKDSYDLSHSLNQPMITTSD